MSRLNQSLEAMFREIKRVQAAKRAAPGQRKALWWTVGWWTLGTGIKKNLLPAVFVGFCGLIAVVLGLFLAPPVRTTEMHLQEDTARRNAEDIAQVKRSMEWNAQARARDAAAKAAAERVDDAERQAAKEAAGVMIRAAGYTCPKVDGMIPFVLSGHGYHVLCGPYTFELTDHGGRWSVTPP